MSNELKTQSIPSVDTACIGMHQMANGQTLEEKMRAEFNAHCDRLREQGRWFPAATNTDLWTELGEDWTAAWQACAAQSAATIARMEEEKAALVKEKSQYAKHCERLGAANLQYAKDLAAAQANNVLLRDVLWGIGHAANCCWVGEVVKDACTPCDCGYSDALAQHLDTSALDAHVAEKTKELQDKVDALEWASGAAALEEKHQKKIAMLVDAIENGEDVVVDNYSRRAIPLEVALTVISATKQDADAFIAEVKAKVLDDSATKLFELEFANESDRWLRGICANKLQEWASELRASAIQPEGKGGVK